MVRRGTSGPTRPEHSMAGQVVGWRWSHASAASVTDQGGPSPRASRWTSMPSKVVFQTAFALCQSTSPVQINVSLSFAERFRACH